MRRAGYLWRRRVKPILQNSRVKEPNKPNLLVLTSSFPNSPDDETCGYIRDFARALSMGFNVRVLAPADSEAVEWPEDSFSLARSACLLPGRLDPFRATVDFNDLLSRSVRVRLAAAVSLAAFFKDAANQAF